MRKKFLLLGLVLALGLILIGCSGGSSTRPYVVATFSTFTGASFGMTTDSSGNLWVTDTDYHSVTKISSAGIPTLFANSSAFLSSPWGIAADASGNLYVCNDGYHDVVKITPTVEYSVYAGTSGTPGSSNTAPVTFNRPYGIALHKASGIMYVADSNNSKIRKIDMNTGVVSDFASVAYVYSVAVDSAGNVYASSGVSNVIVKYTPGGSYDNGYTLSNNPNQPQIYAVAVDSSGNILAADYANHIIWKIDAEGHSSVFAGTPGVKGYVNDVAESALFECPQGIAVDSQDRVYVTDANHVIRRIALR